VRAAEGRVDSTGRAAVTAAGAALATRLGKEIIIEMLLRQP
jgi:hypothetical protein